MDPGTAMLIGGGISAGASFLGGQESARAQERMAKQNIKLQKEFAQEGIRWKVEDAKKAGIHPLYALGANTHSFSPISTGDTSMGSAISNMGQDIGRAISATGTTEEREMSKLQLASAKMDIEGKSLQNQILAAQLGKLQSPASGPPGPGGEFILPGQGDSGLKSGSRVLTTPNKINASSIGKPGVEAGFAPDVSFSRDAKTAYPMVPQGLSESLEDDMIGKLMWRFRNQVLPNLGVHDSEPSEQDLPKGYRWRWNYDRQGWEPYRFDIRTK